MKLTTNIISKDSSHNGTNGWWLIKFFYQEGNRYGEFYMRWNQELGQAEIETKDPDYAEDIIVGFMTTFLSDAIKSLQEAKEKIREAQKLANDHDKSIDDIPF